MDLGADQHLFLPPQSSSPSSAVALSLRGHKQELESRRMARTHSPSAILISCDSLSRRRREGRILNSATLTQPPSKRSARARKEGSKREGRKGIIIIMGASQSARKVVNTDRSLKRHLHHLIHIVDRSFRYGRR